jgi:hypothetical protein
MPCGLDNVPHGKGRWNPMDLSAPSDVSELHQHAAYNCGEAVSNFYNNTGLYFCGHTSRDDLDRAFKQFSWKWEPNRCSLPRFGEGFDVLVRQFLNKAQGHKIILAGDSFMVQQYISIRCLLGGRTRIQGENATQLGCFKTANNIEFINLWSPYLVNRTNLQVIGTDGNGPAKERKPSHYLHNEVLQRDYALSLAEDDYNWANTASMAVEFPYSHLIRENNTYLVINTGAHWHGNMEGYSVMVLEVLEFLQKNFGGKRVFYRASSHGHIDCLNVSSPQKNFEGDRHQSKYNWRILKHYNAIWKYEIARMKDNRIVYLDVSSMSKDRADSHVKTRAEDCFHWCLPGMVDYWNLLMMSHIVHSQNTLIEVDNS